MHTNQSEGLGKGQSKVDQGGWRIALATHIVSPHDFDLNIAVAACVTKLCGLHTMVHPARYLSPPARTQATEGKTFRTPAACNVSTATRSPFTPPGSERVRSNWFRSSICEVIITKLRIIKDIKI